MDMNPANPQPKGLYAPYKVVGYVCDAVPFVMQQLGEEWFITVSVGRCFQVFKFNKLYACLVSQQTPDEISGLQVRGHETYASVGEDIFVFKRARIVAKLSFHTSSVKCMLCIGDNLVSLDVDNNIRVIDLRDRQLISEIKLLRNSTASVMIHPATYLNKVLIGFEDGLLELWNINRKKLIFAFTKHLSRLQSLYSTDSIVDAVTCIEQSPACDVVAVGFASGYIALFNLKYDCLLFTFQQEGGTVTSFSFRTDSVSERYPHMVSASEDGRIHVWNLGDGGIDADAAAVALKGGSQNVRKLQSTIEEAHVDAVSRVCFLHGEPVMVSAGAVDNSLKVWIFDSPDGASARLLRCRSGHRGNPTRIRYYGGITHVSMRDNADATSCEIISVGADSTVRVFNTALEAQNRELSQKPILKKLGIQRRNEQLPPCIGFDYCETRQRDWGNLVTIHEQSPHAYVWKYKHRVATEMILRQPTSTHNGLKHLVDEKIFASAVALSPCGNFCVVGCRNGIIYRYNLQSGLQRGAYPKKSAHTSKDSTIRRKASTPGNVYHAMKEISEMGSEFAVDNSEASSYTLDYGHTGEVTGLYVGLMGTTLVSSSLDGQICFWDFISHELLHSIKQPTTCPHLFLHGFRDADFVAVAGQDRVIRMYDVQMKALARRFANGHSRELTDFAFSTDGRKLLSAALDSTLRVWDIPTGRCISWLLFSSPLLSIAVSVSGEYLCVAQADKEGIYMYIDRSLYETVHFWKEPDSPTPIHDSMLTADSFRNLDEEEISGEGSETEEKKMKKISKNKTAAAPDDMSVADADDDFAASRSWRQYGSEPGDEDGAITMSGTPRAYWTSLFYLEAIKQRNRPKLPPAKPANAPFFLQSVVREGGSAPSFPTPQEFAKLTAEVAAVRKPAADDTNSQQSTKNQGEAKRKIEETSRDAAGKKVKVTSKAKEVDEASIDMNEFAAMSSAWDDDNDIDDDAAEEEKEVKAVVDAAALSNDADASSLTRVTTSRIIRRGTQLPRCKLEAYLRQDHDQSNGSQSPCDILLQYMKQLAPPAVDLEMRSLCTYEGDTEGIHLLKLFISWMKRQILTGHNFELLQAYLHRFLTIFIEIASAVPSLQEDIDALSSSHFDASGRFRHLLQKNLCLLKMTGNIPIS